MAIATFDLEVQSDNALRRELYIAAGAAIDYEVAADRVQRGWIVASRAETSSVTAKEIIRGFKLDVTNVEEPAVWNSATLPPVSLQVPADLSAVSATVDLSTLAHDDEGDAIFYAVGTVPSGITATKGVGQQAHILTVTYPQQFSNPPSNLSFMVPLSLEQPLGTKVAGSDRNLPVRVFRFAPQPIHTRYNSPVTPGRVYIDSSADHAELTLNDYIQNPSNRPLQVGHGSSYAHSWSDANATYVITEVNNVFSFRADRRSPFPFSGTRTSNIQIRVVTDDNGDDSAGFINLLLRVEAPPVGG